MEGRVAQRQVEFFSSPEEAGKHVVGDRLMTQLDGVRQFGVGGNDAPDVLQRLLVRIHTEKTPAIFSVTDQRVDAVGADADIQYP